MATLTGDSRGVVTLCPNCGQKNRLRYEGISNNQRCGRCHTPLEPANTPIAIEDAAVFDAMIGSAALPVVIDFWAAWCGPCRAMAPEFEKVARATAGKWLVAKVDTDKVPELGERYRIMSIPTLAVFRNGHERARRSGAMSASDIQQFMDAAT